MELTEKNHLLFEICRLCLDNRGTTTISEENDLGNKIYKCTGVKICSTDNLPQEICISCLDLVNKADHLRTMASKNDSYLKNLFDKDPKTESITSQSIADTKPKLKVKRKSNSDNDFECTSCSKVYDTWKKLYLHQRYHNKTIFCPIDTCGKKFATNSDLEKHIRAHTGERPFQCSECDKSFTQQGTLKSHRLNVHNAEVL